MLVAIRAWRNSSHPGVQVLVRSDSLSALSAFAKQSSASGNIRLILNEMALDEADMGAGLTSLMHIPGLSNKWPDALSRIWEPKPQAFPNALASVPRTHVPEHTVEEFWLSLGAVDKVRPMHNPKGRNRRVCKQTL